MVERPLVALPELPLPHRTGGAGGKQEGVAGTLGDRSRDRGVAIELPRPAERPQLIDEDRSRVEPVMEAAITAKRIGHPTPGPMPNLTLQEAQPLPELPSFSEGARVLKPDRCLIDARAGKQHHRRIQTHAQLIKAKPGRQRRLPVPARHAKHPTLINPPPIRMA